MSELELPSERVGALVGCAVRYAIGRRSYMPGYVIETIAPVIGKLDNCSLCVIMRDIRNAVSYGMEYEKATWLELADRIAAELEKRRVGKCND
ncbi:hypothetical protein [uncultured Bilophila sp.]|uniref:hypothetical protein n=1 Tax=uncultured Bilophila sp. TaxID=529385 RepID=UPI0026DC3828|nr:hypothetical protein [uncultured Bilophila sp.]